MRWPIGAARPFIDRLVGRLRNGDWDADASEDDVDVVADVRPPPFFVIGAPRSGTSFLMEVLNRHPELFITNETRVMTFVNRCLNVVGSDHWVLMRHRQEFLAHLREELPGVLERFYERIGLPPGVRWGDKHPHYADSKTDPACLDTIDQLFPGSQFINILRDGRAVVASIVNKGWADLDEAIDVWRRHVLHARSFGDKIGPERFLTVRHEEILEDGPRIVQGVFDFLGVDEDPGVQRFLEEQAHERTPFSKPTLPTDQLGRPDAKAPLSEEERDKVEQALLDLLIEFGYVSSP